MSDDEKPVHVLDANVFIHGASRRLPDEFTNPVTVPEVTDELRSSAAGRRFDVEQISVYEPGEQQISRVEDAADEAGEDLSEADIRIIALALEKDGIVVSDDYGVQNIASLLDVRYKGFLKEEITDQIRWRYQCSECGEFVEDMSETDCPACGGELKKVPGEKQDL